MTIEFNNISCSGMFSTTVGDLEYKFSNLLTNTGRLALSSGTIRNALSGIVKIGSSNTAPNVNNVSLSTPYAYTLDVVSFTVAVNTNNPHVIDITNKCTFFNNTGSSKTIREIGIPVTSGSYASSLSIRTTTKDSGGNTADIVVPEYVDYVVDYTYKLNLGASDVSSSFYFNGVTYNYRIVTGVLRPAPGADLSNMSIIIGGHAGSDVDMYSLSASDVLANINSIYTQWDTQYNSTGIYTSTQFTEVGLVGSIASDTYTVYKIAVNTYTVAAAGSLTNLLINKEECNFAGGIKTLFIGLPINNVHNNVFGAILFNPPLPKNSNEKMLLKNIIKTRF